MQHHTANHTVDHTTQQIGTINVVNVYKYTPQPHEKAYYCGRFPASRLPQGYTHINMGNPFKVGPGATNAQVCDQYREYLRDKCRRKEREYDVVLQLAADFNNGDNIVLACHCAPKTCHCNVIEDAIEGYAERMRSQQQQPTPQSVQAPAQQPYKTVHERITENIQHTNQHTTYNPQNHI